MRQFENLTPVEQVLLLAFLPVLGATGQFGTALAAAVTGSIAAITVAGSATFIPGQYDRSVRWVILLAIGFGLSYLLTTLAVYLVPIPQRVRIYLYLTGATPLVYAGAGTYIKYKKLMGFLVRYIVIIIAFGFIRELLGSGSLFGTVVFADGFVPVGLFAGSSGALFLWASLAYISNIMSRRLASTDVDIQKEGGRGRYNWLSSSGEDAK